MRDVNVPQTELDPLGQSPVLFDALIGEDDRTLVFRKLVTRADPGVTAQRATDRWPHHLPGELTIALTGQAGVIAMRRRGLIDADWRGHGVRIRDARFSAPVLLGETCYLRVEIVRTRKLGDSLHVRFRFRMWKHDDGREIETFRSEQDAMFFRV
jgi:acyl dehydratase